MRYRISAGQSIMGGSVDWHRMTHGDDTWFADFCGVDGAIEVPTEAEAAIIASEITAATGKQAYPYAVGHWAPPPGVDRMTLYSPNFGGVLT